MVQLVDANWLFLALIVICSLGAGLMSARLAAYFEYGQMPKGFRVIGAIIFTILSIVMFTIGSSIVLMVLVYFLDDIPTDEHAARAYWREHNEIARRIWAGSLIFSLWLALRVTRNFRSQVLKGKGFPLIGK